MPRITELSVKYLVPPNLKVNESQIFLASLTASSAPNSSILGMEIFILGATLDFPAISLHSTEPSFRTHLA
jgi:hypothetical protein